MSEDIHEDYMLPQPQEPPYRGENRIDRIVTPARYPKAVFAAGVLVIIFAVVNEIAEVVYLTTHLISDQRLDNSPESAWGTLLAALLSIICVVFLVSYGIRFIWFAHRIRDTLAPGVVAIALAVVLSAELIYTFDPAKDPGLAGILTTAAGLAAQGAMLAAGILLLIGRASHRKWSNSGVG